MVRVALVVVLSAAGCSAGPQAPALDPKALVYESAQEGFRFEAPAGWTQTARTELPDGPVVGEPILVRWRRFAGDAAILRAARADLPAAESLAGYLAAKAGGAESWVAKPPAEEAAVGGVAGTRMTYAGVREGKPYSREIVAVRRGGRVYLFTGVFPSGDEEARRLVRAAVAGVKWTGPTQ